MCGHTLCHLVSPVLTQCLIIRDNKREEEEDGKHRDKPGQLLDTASCHQEATVARSDELFSLPVPGSLIRILLLMVITAASHAMCDAQLASDWSALTGPGL